MSTNHISFLECSSHSVPGQLPAAAVVATTTVPAGERRNLEFSLAWDMPIVYFGSKRKKHYRYFKTIFEYCNTVIMLNQHLFQYLRGSVTKHPNLIHSRRYTRFFGYHGNAGPSLVCHALRTYPEWEAKIDEWQQPILKDKYELLLSVIGC